MNNNTGVGSPRRHAARALGIAASAALAALVGGWALPAGAAGATYPDHVVTLVSAFPPGGSTDVIARLLSPRMGSAMGQSFVVENRAGASGNIASEYVARAKPDGYTLLVGNNTMTLNVALGVKQTFDLKKDLVPIAEVAITPVALAVNANLPVNSVAELIAYGKANPGKLSFSSCGNGTAQHFAGVEFAHRAGIDMVHVPYKGCAPALNDGLGGTVPVLFNAITNISPQLKSGKIRLLAVATKDRVPMHPDTPAISETPGFQGYDFSVWLGIFAPAGTPKPVVDQLQGEMLKMTSSSEMKEALTSRLFVPSNLNGEQLAAQIADELSKWKTLADEYKITAD
jgi:tripartite-type tricarboxylate transporter receptor subunit TctC